MNAPQQMLQVCGLCARLMTLGTIAYRRADTLCARRMFSTVLLVHPAATSAHHKMTRALTIIGAALLGSISYGATAGVVLLEPAPAIISADLRFNFTPPDPLHVNTFGRHDLTGGPGGSRAFVDSGRTPSPFLFVSVPQVFDFVFGRVSGVLDYEFVITGPSGSVPVIAVASGRAQAGVERPPLASGSFALQAAWSISEAISGTTVFSDEGIHTPELTGSFADSFEHTRLLDLTTNQRYRVRLIADAAVANGSSKFGPSFAFSIIDPVFSFAPGVGPEYSFVFSEGVGNAPSVPEPGTLGLLCVGLLAFWLAGVGRVQTHEHTMRTGNFSTDP